MENFTETTESSREKHQTPMLADEVYNEASSGEHDETIDESTLVKLHQEVRTSRLRIVVLTVFAGLNFVTQVQYVTFSTIVRETQGFYHISALTVNVLCLIIPLVFAIGAYPGCLVYNKIGLWNGFLLGFSVNSFAGVLKFISVVKPHVAFLVVAQVCVGIGQLFSLGLASLVSSVWFPVHERSLATSFGALFGFVGMAVGMFYSPFMVDTADDVAGWVTLWVTQFGFSGLFLAFHGFSKLFIPERPKYPPALTATTELDTVPLPTVFKAVLKNKKFIYVTLVFGVISGFLTAVAAMLIQLLEPFGIPETTSGILAFFRYYWRFFLLHCPRSGE
ncbi:hypothetical protein AGDE_02365 [Angomonas deanei]|nr:hypothetical protein AGDE_02365 [Angomonas deanei]|eukprot:EPY41559.1 hypothetical protein AGDE_02365 [Angomonas deanei]